MLCKKLHQNLKTHFLNFPSRFLNIAENPSLTCFKSNSAQTLDFERPEIFPRFNNTKNINIIYLTFGVYLRYLNFFFNLNLKNNEFNGIAIIYH